MDARPFRRGVHPGHATAASLCLALLGGMDAAAQALTLAPALSVGTAEGDPRTTFGIVADVASDPRGNLFVLDANERKVRVFSPRGAFLAEMGRAGSGPGEFFVPLALAHGPAGDLYVLDVGNQRVEVFSFAENRARHLRSFRIDFAADDICALGDRLYLLGYRNGSVVHELTSSGRLVRSFGGALQPTHPYLRVALSRGYLACMEQPAAVVVLPTLSPVVRAFTPQGRALWTAAIPGYESVVIRTSGSGVVYEPGRTGRHHMASSAAAVGPGLLLVQVGVAAAGARSRHELGEVSSYLVSARDGGIRPLPAGTPRIVSARRGLAYSARTEPYPAVTVYRISPPPARER